MTRSTAHSRTWKSIAPSVPGGAHRHPHAHSEDDHRKPDVLEAIRRSMRTRYAHFAYFVGNDRIVCSTTMKTSQASSRREPCARCSPLFARTTRSPSSPTSPRSAKAPTGTPSETSTKRCSIYQIFGGSAPRNRCVFLQRSGMSAGVLNVEDFEELRSSIDPRILKLHERERRTVRHPCGAVRKQPALPGNRSAAVPDIRKPSATESTKSEAVYDVDVHDPDDFLQILLAGRIMTLAENVG